MTLYPHIHIYIFYVLYDTFTLLQNAWKVAKVGNFGAVRAWGPDAKIGIARARAISQSDWRI